MSSFTVHLVGGLRFQAIICKFVHYISDRAQKRRYSNTVGISGFSRASKIRAVARRQKRRHRKILPRRRSEITEIGRESVSFRSLARTIEERGNGSCHASAILKKRPQG